MQFLNQRNLELDVSALLKRLGIKAKKISKTKWVAFCPHPEHVNTHTPAWFIRDNPGDQFHASHVCKSCGFKGGTLSLVEGVLGLNREQATEWLHNLDAPKRVAFRLEIEVKETSIQSGGMRFNTMEIDFHPDDFHPDGLAYLQSRGVTREQIDRWGIGCAEPRLRNGLGPHPLRGRIVIPIKDPKGRWLAYTARDYTGKSEVKYREPAREENPSTIAVFGEQHWNDQETIVLCEGAFNALAAERVLPEWIAVGALRGSDPNPTKLSKLLRFRRIVVATDNDKAGIRVAKEIRLLLGSDREILRACPPEGRDLNDLPEDEHRAFLGGIIGLE